MAAGQARRLHGKVRRKIAIFGRNGRPRFHDLWRGLPYIATLDEIASGLEVQKLLNGPGARPYIDYSRSTTRSWRFQPWDCQPGEILLSEEERDFGARHAGHVVVEPSVKASASPNKSWGYGRTQDLARRMKLPWAQVGPNDARWMTGVERIVTPTFRHAAAVLSQARCYVGPEGGLHHAAAAFGIPAVVIFGSYISPEVTGYAGHTNIYRPHGPGPCGARRECHQCRAAMNAITPEEIAQHLERTLA